MLYRAVVAAMLVSLGGVIMIAQPAFLFGGTGINKLGLLLALLQVRIASLGSLTSCQFRLSEPRLLRHWRSRSATMSSAC